MPSLRSIGIALVGLGSQSFLGHRWAGRLLAMTPEKSRRGLALRLLYLSPHYFYHTPSNRGLTHAAFLEFEYERNVRSREFIIKDLVAPHVNASQTVVDYGCGPGFLARWSAPLVGKLIACDIAAGVLSCARVINGSPNAEFATVGTDGRIPLPDNSVDVVYSFAVIMHVTNQVFEGILSEWQRILRPGGKVICHIAMDPPGWKSEAEWRADRSPAGLMRWHFGLHGFKRSEGPVRAAIVAAGFTDPRIQSVREMNVRFEDDIAVQHLWTFEKPA